MSLLLWASVAQGNAQVEGELTELLNRVTPDVITQFNTPGVTIAVFNRQRVLFHKAYGTRDVQQQLPVTTETYFRIASTTKAITAASLAILVEDEQLSWDDKVTQYLPQFQMSTQLLTQQMRVVDLLSHNSGLRSGGGDSMLWPEPASFTPEEIVHNLRFITPQNDFRSQFSYSNVLYVAAAEVVSEVSKMSWADFVEKRIFQPLKMRCFASNIPPSAVEAAALPYGHNAEQGIYLIPRNAIQQTAVHSVAAGGVVCNSDGMVKWLQHLLQIYVQPELSTDSLGTLSTVLSAEQLEELWRPRTVMPVSEFEQQWHRTALKSYALGWRVSQFGPHKMLSHTGTLSGYQAQVALLPDVDLGIVILNNGSNYGVRGSLLYTILHHLLAPDSQQDWVTVYREYQQQQLIDYLANLTIPQGNGLMLRPTEDYVGEYADQWFGSMTITQEDNLLRIASARMPMLTGYLEPFEQHRWVIRWDNQNAASDVFIQFSADSTGEIEQFTILPLRSELPENHEWQDMRFIKATN
ncbi:serine hydrolase [Alteromonas sp. ASW11-36]|uniref:Serine hydrolase n=1 Tax=Alteromonas arenosi TaxID=3055817 RepID=A0ABT7STT3_9ALTE|nr:serine hydrolase [Alteromonas sp. ASW11-36]MDM7859597.1 serine hydrolase [Alteromonas sp. ASW11-36]